ncbi:Exopolysaccharide biosynthesis protein [Lachnospiraceae bacterium TWA4]|nr:Exopolysaccharide biosynthesis protein [Lachnospiraceae bacterium TWA4]
MATGVSVHDTQTGLRAFTSQMIPQLLEIKGERYEYEMNMLLECSRKKIPIREVEIETIYLEGNASSHFDTLKDSYRIYKEILKFMTMSLVGFLVDYGLYSLSLWVTGIVTSSNIGARVVSAGVNYTLNRKYVFKSEESVKTSACKYFALAMTILIGNTLVLGFLVNGLGMNGFIAKIFTEMIFFLFSWFMQRTFVFKGGTHMGKKKGLWAVAYGLGLVAFTTYTLLNTFVLTKVYSTVSTVSAAESNSTEKSSSTAEAIESTSTNTSYSDENLTITIKEYREYDTTIYVADVQLKSADALKTAFAQNSYGKNVTAKTSEISESVGAILAINGDFYGAQESGYVIRNGVIYREEAQSGNEDLVIYSDGSFEIIQEDEVSAKELLDKGAMQVLSFGPALVTSGEISVSEGEEVGKAKASNPRTAIGIIDDLHYVFVVSDGRTSESAGLSLSQLATFMDGLGVTTAYNLDGGESSTMYFNGSVVNNPTTDGRRIKERSVSDIVYIG